MSKPKKTAIIGTSPVQAALVAVKKHKGEFSEPVTKTMPLDSIYKRPTFKSQKALDKFLKETKYIYLKKVPKMPFNLVNDYVREYILIYNKQCKLSATQRIYVKNIVHYHLRKGTITLQNN